MNPTHHERWQALNLMGYRGVHDRPQRIVVDSRRSAWLAVV